MTRTLFIEEEVRLVIERRLKYIRAAKNIARLHSVFRKNYCRRLDINNYIPTIVSRHNLANALRKANIL
ncbi:uncharacterized protein N7498_006381 [Penicillium cinerascens]|uniref:Uncharacterized protein n=1 Tax=Penicillium cinerascens TaxID=70096 RepID=A0A9W9MI49_9EURO|nr:uncharacterized protein N7498_006381 [Penicillium cinerascens]KAJ5201718.1 hypothetical protein N7498_006381 [Penicillium cinerascens]